MEAVAVVFGIMVVGVFFAGIVGVILHFVGVARKRTDDSLRAAAARMTGEVVEGGFWKGNHLRFRVDGVEGRMTWFSGTDKAPPWTKVQFDWRPPGRLRVGHEGFFQRIGKFFGSQDIRIGDSGFDERFLIQGEPESWVRDVLDEEMKGRLVRLSDRARAEWRRSSIRLDVAPTGMTLFVQDNLVRRGQPLVDFLEAAEAVFLALRSPGSKGLEVTSVETLSAEGCCQVCGDSLSRGKTRTCPRCGTPHHRDCWAYNGGCSTFACGGRG